MQCLGLESSWKVKGADTSAGGGVQQGSGLIRGGGGEPSVDARRGKSCVRPSQGGGNKWIIKTKPSGARVADRGSPGALSLPSAAAGSGEGVLLAGLWCTPRARSRASAQPPAQRGAQRVSSVCRFPRLTLGPSSQEGRDGQGAGPNLFVPRSVQDPGHQMRREPEPTQTEAETFASQCTIDSTWSLRHESKPCDDTKQCLIIKSALGSRAHLFQIKGITEVFTGLLTNSGIFVWSCPGQTHLSSRSLPIATTPGTEYLLLRKRFFFSPLNRMQG